jgi:hypothetical protein
MGTGADKAAMRRLEFLHCPCRIRRRRRIRSHNGSKRNRICPKIRCGDTKNCRIFSKIVYLRLAGWSSKVLVSFYFRWIFFFFRNLVDFGTFNFALDDPVTANMLAELKNVESAVARSSLATARDRSLEDRTKISAVPEFTRPPPSMKIPAVPEFTGPTPSMKPLFASSPLTDQKPSAARKPADFGSATFSNSKSVAES